MRNKDFVQVFVFTFFAIVALFTLPYQRFEYFAPKKSSRSCTIYFNYPGAPPSTIEHEITSKLEGLLANISGIKEIWSESKYGQGKIKFKYSKKTQKKVLSITVSKIVNSFYRQNSDKISYPRVIHHTTSNNTKPFFVFNIALNNLSIDEIDQLEKDLFTRIKLVKGVSELLVNGKPMPTYKISLKRTGLSDMLASPDKIVQSINRSTNLNQQIGLIKNKRGNIFAIKSPANKKEALPNILITFKEQYSIPLHKLARISKFMDFQKYKYKQNGKPVIEVSVIADKGSNLPALSKKILEILEKNNFRHSENSYYIKEDESVPLLNELKFLGIRATITIFILLLFLIFSFRNKRLTLIAFYCLIINIFLSFMLYAVFNLRIDTTALMIISLGLGVIIDNIIIMLIHFTHNNNTRFIQAILGANLTTLLPLGLYLLLTDDNTRMEYIDTYKIFFINIFVSLLVIYIFLPSITRLVEKRHRTQSCYISDRILTNRKKWIYTWLSFFNFSPKYKWIIFPIIILIIGVPISLLPNNWEKNNQVAKIYNEKIYDIKNSKVAKFLGGGLRFFIDDVPYQYLTSDGFHKKKETLNLYLYNPYSTDSKNFRNIIQQVENKLSEFNIIKNYYSTINKNKKCHIEIHFKEMNSLSKISPGTIKAYLIHLLLNYWGIDWQISGYGRPFGRYYSKSIHPDLAIELLGPDLTNLIRLGEKLSNKIVVLPQIDHATISTTPKYTRQSQNLILNKKNPSHSDAIHLTNNNSATTIFNNTPLLIKKEKKIKKLYEWLTSPYYINDSVAIRNKLIYNTKKQIQTEKIIRENQKYKLHLCLNTSLSSLQLKNFESDLKEYIKKLLPAGYNVKEQKKRHHQQKQQKRFLLLAVLLIYFICAIIFESLKKPLIIILSIPVSFIGIFYIHYWLMIFVNEGSYAGMFLVSIITVNAIIYILSKYELALKHNHSLTMKRRKHLFKISFAEMTSPVMFTIISTIISFAPFVFFNDISKFWYNLGLTVISGLITSFFYIFIILPLFYITTKDNSK